MMRIVLLCFMSFVSCASYARAQDSNAEELSPKSFALALSRDAYPKKFRANCPPHLRVKYSVGSDLSYAYVSCEKQ